MSRDELDAIIHNLLKGSDPTSAVPPAAIFDSMERFYLATLNNIKVKDIRAVVWLREMSAICSEASSKYWILHRTIERFING